MNTESTIFEQLSRPFHPSHVEWKPGAVKGERALAIAYADLRAYMHRLDEVCGDAWQVTYEPWGPDRIICRLTIQGITRSSTGETTNESEKNEIGGTVAEAQAFKRACVMFGLGRYLYNLPSGWVDYDPKTRQFTEGAKAKLNAMLVQHYRRTTEGAPKADTSVQNDPGADGTPPHQRMWGLGLSVFGPDWDMARPWLLLGWTEKVQHSEPRDSAAMLSNDEKDLLADYISQNSKSLQDKWKKHKAMLLQSANGAAA